MPASGSSCSARSASSTATSAPARSTRCARRCTAPPRDGLAEREVIGIVSLLLWTLILIVTLKYVVLILRADNNGEGGTLSLLALAQRAVGRRTPLLFVLGVAGAALFYGDAAITPAISVLSAVEGLKLVTPAFEPYVLPITVAILIGAVLGAEPRHRAGLGALRPDHARLVPRRSPALGLLHAGDRPAIFTAFNRRSRRSASWSSTGSARSPVMGSVFLAVTGAEALYADMGHFGRGPIRFAWTGAGLPGAGAQLPRPGQPGARPPGGGGEPVLPAGARLGPAAAGAARHRAPR